MFLKYVLFVNYTAMINILYTYRTESRHGRKGRDGVVRLQGAALVAVRHKIYMPLLLSVIYHYAF